MQTLELPADPKAISTFQDKEGYYIESYLISTKPNDANWRIKKETGHEKVKTFLDKDFPIIPELIQKLVTEGGGGHVKGSRQEILDQYAKHSHGKIIKLKGPYYYNDGTEDYFYRAITKLSDSRAASVLMNEGEKTWVKYAVSPHIFVNKGNDIDGWEDWEGAGLCLVIKGAYGPDAVITKLCKGSETKCTQSLVASIPPSQVKEEDERLAALISSSISKIASVQHTMPENQTSNATSSPAANLQETNPTVSPQKSITEGQIQQQSTTTPAPAQQPEAKKIEVLEDEWNKLKAGFTQMENERKNEILTVLLSPYITDEKERKEEIKQYVKYDRQTIDLLKTYHESLAPKIEASVKAKIEEEQKEAAKKEEKEKPKSRHASTSSLRPEPKRYSEEKPEEESEQEGGEGQSKAASVTEIRNEAYLLRQKLFGGSDI